jgi:hypothetical protein
MSRKTQEGLVRLLFFKKQAICLTERKKKQTNKQTNKQDLYPGPTAYEVDKVALEQVF